MLDLLANLSEILAGIAIVIAAARAWPLLGAMNRNLITRRRRRGGVGNDLRRLSAGVERELDVPNPRFSTLQQAREGLMLILADAHATNLHMQLGGLDPEHPGTVKVRVEGDLVTICRLSADAYVRLIDEFKDWAGMSAELSWGRARGAGSFAGREYSVLIRLAESVHGPAMTAHLLDTAVAELPVAALGMPSRTWQMIEPLLDVERGGLVVFAGLSGSGKTVSLYTSMNQLDPVRCNVVTVEDPVELLRPGVTQIEVDSPRLGLTEAFSLARNMDPDVLMVGELRPDTVRMVLRSYYDGCLTLTTAPSRSVLATLAYLDSYSQVGIRELIFPMVIVAQRLMRGLCVECREPTELDEDDIWFVNQVLDESARTWDDIGATFFVAHGCRKCEGGHEGRIACYEAMQVDFEILDSVRSNRNPRKQLEYAVGRGFEPMQFHALRIAAQGEVSLAEVRRVVTGLRTASGTYT